MGQPVACKKTPIGPKSPVLIEVGVPKRFEAKEGLGLPPLTYYCDVGGDLIKPTCTRNIMKYDVGDLNGDGARDYFVVEERGSEFLFYAESGKNKSCVSGFFITRFEIAKVLVRKCGGCSEGIFTITFKEREWKYDSNRVQIWNGFGHERMLVIGARNMLECLYPSAFKDAKGKEYGPGNRRWDMVDNQGKSIKVLLAEPLNLGSFGIPR